MYEMWKRKQIHEDVTVSNHIQNKTKKKQNERDTGGTQRGTGAVAAQQQQEQQQEDTDSEHTPTLEASFAPTCSHDTEHGIRNTMSQF